MAKKKRGRPEDSITNELHIIYGRMKLTGKFLDPTSMMAMMAKRAGGHLDSYFETRGQTEAAQRLYIRNRAKRYLKKRDRHIIGDNNEYRPYWDATKADRLNQTMIKEESSDYDRIRIAIDHRVNRFLDDMEDTYGQDVTPAMFEEEVAEIWEEFGRIPPDH